MILDAPEEEEAPPFQPSVAADPECVAWIKAKLYLPGLNESMFTPEHDETIADFIVSTSVRRLIAFIDPLVGLSVSLSVPQVLPAFRRPHTRPMRIRPPDVARHAHMPPVSLIACPGQSLPLLPLLLSAARLRDLISQYVP